MMTNREWLRGMSDSELAVKVVRMAEHDACKYCGHDIECLDRGNRDCHKGIEEWLGEEHKDGEE